MMGKPVYRSRRKMAERSGGGGILLVIYLLLIIFSCLELYCSAASDPAHRCKQDGYFGRSCHFKCNCATDGEICDKETGECNSGCAGDFWGKHCLLTSNCSYNDAQSCSEGVRTTCTGYYYMGKRNRTENGGECRNWTEARSTFSKHLKRLDGSRSAAKNYCRLPDFTDGYQPWCYLVNQNGNWEYCNVVPCGCPNYRFGRNCDDECRCYDVNEVCHKETGACPKKGCWKGGGGSDCKSDCSDGKFGISCSYTCHCKDNAICNKTTGKCPSDCAYGWSGEACQIGNGAYGKLASQSSTHDTLWSSADKAIDNDTNPKFSDGKCSQTNREDKPWWRVDLRHRHRLLNLTIYNRDCSRCKEDRLKNIKIWMTDTNGVPTDDKNLCYYFSGGTGIPDSGSKIFHCTKPVIGQYLFIQLQDNQAVLNLCEVKIHAYQYNDCLYKTHGPNCNLKCQCQDTSETCDVITGGCTSGCNNLYAGKNCEIMLPSMKQKPTRKSHTQNSITVSWPAWNERLDNGGGPVTGYKLQYSERGTSVWTDTEFTTGLQRTVTGLKGYAFYDFRVILRWQADSTTSSKVGPVPGPEAVETMRTSCLAPNSGPVISSNNGHIEDMTVWPSKIALDLTWQETPQEDLNCESLKEYVVYYQYYQSTEWLQDSTATTTLRLTNLFAFMRYEVIIGVVNEDGYQTNGSVTVLNTPEGRPGDVTHLTAEPLAGGELKITWNKPSKPYGDIISYYIQWEHLADRVCRNVVSGVTAKHLSKLTLTYRISSWTDDLCHDCLYSIRVFAENTAGNGTVREVKQSTLSEAPTKKPVARVSSSYTTSRSVSIEWDKYPCQDQNGPNGKYQITIKNLTDNSVRILVPIPLGSTRWKRIDGLIPYTQYSVSFAFVNDKGSSPDIILQFRTKEEVPPAPRLEKLSTSPSSITIAWYPPDPPYGLIVAFKLQHWEEGHYSDTLDTNTVSNGNAGNMTFNKLTTNVRYVFKIIACNGIGWGTWSDDLVVLTEEDWPGIPANLEVDKKTSESFRLTWQKPVVPFVDLTGCKIVCYLVDSYDPSVTINTKKPVNEFTPNKWITSKLIEGLSQATQYNCSVTGLGNRGYGKAAWKLSWTIPRLDITDEKFVKIKSLETTDHTITVHIPSAKVFGAPVSSFLIGVEDKTRQRQKRGAVAVTEGLNLSDYHTAKNNGLHWYVAAELPQNFSGPFTIGDGKTYGKYTNQKLETGHSYDVLFGVVSDLDGERTIKFARTSDQITVIKFKEAKSPVVIIVVVVILIIAIIVVAVGVGFYIRRRRQKHVSQCESLMNMQKIGPKETTILNGVANPAVIVTSHDEEMTDSCEDLINETEADEDLYENVPNNPNLPKSHAILLDDIIQYNISMKKNKCSLFKAEYEQFKPQLEYAYEVSQRSENRGKNRFKNIVAYDHSRVILDVGDEDEDDSETDYINANYIDGYKKKKAYIGAQGPTKMAINDIWRAVWQERCPKIVMLTNFVEQGKPKCERYWPESGKEHYGEFTVEVVTEEKFTDMVVTSIKLSKYDQERRLKHFHFTAWPDHGAPKFASSMLHFWREVSAYSGEMYGPIYIHCSAGVGRTGTFIGLDYLIQQGSAEKMVNVYECVRQMRLSRPKMVQTVEQYVFLHDALAEHFRVGLTAFPSSMFCDRYGSMVVPKKKGAQSRLQQQFKLLAFFTPEVSLDKCKHATSEENLHKNRSSDVIPEDRCRACLTLPVAGYNSYINAVFIDGYSKRDTYIVSQMPLPHTVIDLWRLVYDQNVTSIVMLNEVDPSCQDCVYWPSMETDLDNEAFSVEMHAEDTSNSDITIRDFKFVRKSRLKMNDQVLQRCVRQFQLNSWPEDKEVAISAKSIVSLVDDVERWQQRSGDGKILVHCMDGAAKSGVFCIAYSVIEKNKLDHDVDVFQFTRLTRMNRPQLVPSYEQYKFIHDVISEYLKQFDVYANFN